MNTLCPKCGKQMIESPKWNGLWSCPGYKKPLNSSPPFKYECDGLKITKKGRDGFNQALRQLICQSN